MNVYVLTENSDGTCLAVTTTFDGIKKKMLEYCKQSEDVEDDEILKVKKWIKENSQELDCDTWWIELSGWYDSLIISKMEIEN